MGIASFSPTGLLGSVHGLFGWLTASTGKHNGPRAVPTLRPGPARSHPCASATHPGYAAAPTLRAVHAGTPSPPQRPLRVLRVVDAQYGNANAGRMLISGRMADVCAELDRLAALEAAPRNGTLLQ